MSAPPNGTPSRLADTTSARPVRRLSRRQPSRWRTPSPTSERRSSVGSPSTTSRRATRKLWARIMRERFQARDPRSWLFRFHVQTAGSTLTAQQSDVNLVRVTLQALAAVLGGAQSLHTNARDEALALPTEASALTALRTQQILAAESGVANTVDPLGGSYFIEHLTREIERGAEEYIRKIDA